MRTVGVLSYHSRERLRSLARYSAQFPAVDIGKSRIRSRTASQAWFSSDDGSKTSLTMEEAGRRAFDRANTESTRKEKIGRLLQAVDCVENDDSSEAFSASKNLATLLAHAGIESGGSENFPMSPPLHTATTYTRPPDSVYKEGLVKTLCFISVSFRKHTLIPFLWQFSLFLY